MGRDPSGGPHGRLRQGPAGSTRAALRRAARHRASSSAPLFWYDWGPVFYRGRLTGKARLLGIASDPGPTERIVGRTLVGDAGQRVQGFLEKVGLTRSYVLVNAFPVAVHPGKVEQGRCRCSRTTTSSRWRNRFYDLVTGPDLEAIVAFGGNAHARWTCGTASRTCRPSRSRTPRATTRPSLLAQWRTAIPDLRAAVTPDPDGTQGGANYGTTFRESDYRRSRPRTCRSGCRPGWATTPGAAGQATAQQLGRAACASDQDHTLVWQAPSPQDLEVS